MAVDEYWWHPDAEEEYVASFGWYYDRNSDAADKFEIELERALKLIARNPAACSAGILCCCHRNPF